MEGPRKNGKCSGMKRSKGGDKLLEWKKGITQTPQTTIGTTTTTTTLGVGGIGKCKRGKFSTRRKHQNNVRKFDKSFNRVYIFCTIKLYQNQKWFNIRKIFIKK